MPGIMLDYTKMILQKVSFDALLFTKELKKAILWLLPDEIDDLKVWLQQFILDKPNLQHSMIVLKPR